MRHRFPLRRAVLGVVMLVLPLGVSGAQAPSPASAPPVAITPGTRIQFADSAWHQGATVEGQVTRRWSDSVAVHADGELSPTAYRIADLRSVSVSEGRPVSGDRVAKGALYGAVGGAVLGGALISFMFHTETSDKHPKGRALDIGVAAAFGLVAGAIGGAMHAPERWRAVSPR